MSISPYLCHPGLDLMDNRPLHLLPHPLIIPPAMAHPPGPNTAKIVVIGGGTGNFVVLNGLKHHTPNLTAIVSMSDSGGSSGRLRDQLGQLPPGDVRQCLLGLSPDNPNDSILRRLLDYRFDRGRDLQGHSFGNLMLAALTEITGSMALAIIEAGRMLQITGRVLPVTLTDTNLKARLIDGTVVSGEASIDVRGLNPGVHIDYVYLDPPALVYPPVVEAILDADLVVMGPGDLYTSIIPNLMVEGVGDAIARTPAPVLYASNIMTKPGESDGFKVSNFVGEVKRYLGPNGRIDYLLVNNGPLPPEAIERYGSSNAYPVELDYEESAELVGEIVTGQLVGPGPHIRHDSRALADMIMAVARGHAP